jgi:predicted RNA-binding Zn ribbon-like protein
MFRLDDELLKELGLIDLPPEEKKKMFNHIYETLEMRVGTRLANQMSDEQLNEFESYIDKNDEAGALKWLETNFPNYKQVVADELEKLKSEIKQVAPQILASIKEQGSIEMPGSPPVTPSQPTTNNQ